MPLDLGQLVPFLVASVLVTVVPGADMALVTRQVLVGGPRLAHRTILGNLAGIVVHGVALAVGLSALIVASASAYTVLKLAGAAYLVWLGVQALRSSAVATPPPTAVSRRAFAAGFLSTVLNPKPALFFLTFVPQFVDRDGSVLAQTLFFTLVHVVVGLVWLTAFAHLVHRAHGVLTGGRVRRWLEASTGAVLIALGVRVAVERR